MNLVIPKALHKRVVARAQKYGVSEDTYIRTVIKNALSADSDLDEDMRLWEQASIHDFNTFAKAHNL